MWGFGRKAPHTFTELIFNAEAKYPNWDPDEAIINVGDYGFIDKETAAFRRQGNIYEDSIILQAIPNITEYNPIPGQWTDHHEVVSKTGRSVGIRANGQVESTTGSNAVFEGSWEFNRERGALFVMRNVTVTRIPPTINDETLDQLMQNPKLKGMALVTDVWKCSGYVRYLSSKGGDNISIKLVADAPVPHAPTLSAGGSVSAHWERKNGTGSLKQAYQTGTPAYSGMYTLRMMRRKKRIFFRGSGMAPEGEGTEKLGLYRPPWENDEEFEEEAEDFDVEATGSGEAET